jgi:hypothetical protein
MSGDIFCIATIEAGADAAGGHQGRPYDLRQHRFQCISNDVEQPSGKLDPALWMLPASFPEGQAAPI